MNSYTAIAGQTLYDVALEVYGDIEGIWWLLEDNPGLELGLSLPAGLALSIRAATMNRQTIKNLRDYFPLATA